MARGAQVVVKSVIGAKYWLSIGRLGRPFLPKLWWSVVEKLHNTCGNKLTQSSWQGYNRCCLWYPILELARRYVNWGHRM